MGQITQVSARQILDSRGFPTIEVDVFTSSGIIGRASVPSGVSTSSYEAIELRDGDSGFYMGKGVLKAIENVNTIINDELNGIAVTEQALIDQVMINLDGTENKSKLGANAILGVSLAVAKAGALFTSQPVFRYLGGVHANTLPIPMINIINGGMHASNNIDFQEFMIMPLGAESFSDALRMSAEVFFHLKSILKSKKLNTNVGDEGGFAPSLNTNRHAIELIIEAIEKAGLKPANDIALAIDAASTAFYDKTKKKYHISSEGKSLSSKQMVEYWKNMVNAYPVVSIEDGMAEDDWEGWRLLNQELGNQIQIVGDDLFATNTNRILKGITENCVNGILIKLNQIGTLTETIDALNLARNNAINAIISHRSGETEDTFIADLSVAFNTELIKTGSLSRSERMAKYNQLLRIEESLGPMARYPGRTFKYQRK